jgi:FMN phosphatase YigB (HAD superfamily)
LNHIHKKILIWDLDDTIFHPPSTHTELDTNIHCYDHVIELLEDTSFEHILVTAYTYGSEDIQNKKIDMLQIRHLFKEIHMCKEKEDKKNIFVDTITKSNASQEHIYVLGDRHDGELAYGKTLGIKTICVALPNGKYLDASKYSEYDYIVSKEEDFLKVRDL